MERQNEIYEELNGFAPVLVKNGITAHPYRVPTGYFDHFAETLLNRIHVESGNQESDPLSELKALSPLLAGMQRKTPYSVPDGYFQEFSANTTTPVLHREEPIASPGKLVPFSTGRRLMKYAVAALITGVIATTTFFALHKTQEDPLNALTNISDQDMASYLDNHDVHWSPGNSAPTASVDYNDNDISDLLSNISDTELEQYAPDQPGQKQIVN